MYYIVHPICPNVSVFNRAISPRLSRRRPTLAGAESVSRWGQGLNVKQAAPTRKKGHFDVFERI